VHLLLVNQGDQTTKRFIARRLAAAGHRIALLHWKPEVWDRHLFDEVMAIRFADPTGVAETAVRAHQRDPFDGVLCYAEASVPVANEVARVLGLPVVSAHWGDAFRYKDRMRIAWEAAGLRVPRYRVIRRRTDYRALGTWRFPVVLKPVAMLGSRGVTKVDSYADLDHYGHLPFHADQDMSIGGERWSMSELFDIPEIALAEEYVSGPEFSAEGVVVDGDYRLVGITQKFTTEEPYFDEVAHLFPATALPGPVDEIRGVLAAAHRALGMRNAVTHTEFRIDGAGACLMELNARLPGDHIIDLVQTTTGCDLVAAAVGCACGTLSPCDLPGPKPAGAPAYAATVYVTAPPETWGRRYQEVVLPELPPGRLVAQHAYASAGSVLIAPHAWGTVRVACAVLAGDDPAELISDIARVRSKSEVRCNVCA
jgi:biotin carboxylase